MDLLFLFFFLLLLNSLLLHQYHFNENELCIFEFSYE